MNPFDYLTSINQSKEDIMVLPEDEKAYSSYMVNRGLSYFKDTVLLANEMNVKHHADSRLQYDFLRQMVRPRKRFSKWFKPEYPKELEAVKEYFGYSNDKAVAALRVLTADQLKQIKAKIKKGGKKGG